MPDRLVTVIETVLLPATSSPVPTDTLTDRSGGEVPMVVIAVATLLVVTVSVVLCGDAGRCAHVASCPNHS